MCVVDVVAGRPGERRAGARDRIRQVREAAGSSSGDQIPITAHVCLDVRPIGVLVYDDSGEWRAPAVSQQDAVLAEPVIVSAVVGRE